jgi:hypothetical protein
MGCVRSDVGSVVESGIDSGVGSVTSVKKWWW